jgi:hypothetical protein
VEREKNREGEIFARIMEFYTKYQCPFGGVQ